MSSRDTKPLQVLDRTRSVVKREIVVVVEDFKPAFPPTGDSPTPPLEESFGSKALTVDDNSVGVAQSGPPKLGWETPSLPLHSSLHCSKCNVRGSAS